MNILRRLLACPLAVALVLAPIPSRASQDELVPPTSGVFTGVQFSQLLGDAFRSLASLNKGSIAAANVSGAAIDGLPWLDDSSSPWALKVHADGNWPTVGWVDDVNGRWVGVLGGGTASLASAATTDLGTVAPANVTITGTTTITSFGSTAPTGVMKVIRFEGALTLTHSAGLKVPGGYSLTTAADDRAIVTHLGSGAWEITHYTRASGVPIDVSAVGQMSYGMFEAAPQNSVLAYGQALTRTSYPAYLAKVTRTQNATRTASSTTLTLCCDATNFGAGMPIEGTGIPAGTTIASVSGGATITLSQAATSSGTASATVFLTGYGTSGSSSTVGAPDCRGSFISGFDNIGGSAAGRLTFANTFIAQFYGARGGSDAPHLLLPANLPNYTLSISGAISGTGQPTIGGVAANAFNSSVYATATVSTTSLNVTVPQSGSVATLDQTVVSGSISSGATSSINQNQTQQSFGRMPPTLMMNCAVRVTP